MSTACGFPRLYAAASLKLSQPQHAERQAARFSAALCRGLIEAAVATSSRRLAACFPRLYAAASLKQGRGRGPGRGRRAGFSAALCRGLIEAHGTGGARRRLRRFPRLYAAASLKPWLEFAYLSDGTPFSAALCRGLIEAAIRSRSSKDSRSVFRGFMPRPH